MDQDLEQAKQGVPGLHLVAEPAETVDSKELIDIVAVHGLGGHCVDSWTYRDTPKASVFWLQDLLPEKMPNARIMTFQYDAKVVGNTSVSSVSDNARQLAELLRDKRDPLDGVDPNRPIVFIGHSLGGIVIKQALQVANADDKSSGIRQIAGATKGLVFFGTPHRGADPAKLLGPIVKAVATVPRKPSSKFVAMLKTHSEGLLKVSQDFRPFAPQYALVSFYEQHVHPASKTLVVDKMSAVMGFPHEDKLMLGGTHSSMCKFTRGDPRFNTVWRSIRRAAAGPPRRGP